MLKKMTAILICAFIGSLVLQPLLGKGVANELNMLSTSITVNQENDLLTFQLKLLNKGEMDTTVTFPTGQLFDIVLEDEAGNIVYHYGKDKMFTQALVDKTVKAKDHLLFTAETTFDRKEWKPGTYHLKGEVQVIAVNGIALDKPGLTIEKQLLF